MAYAVTGEHPDSEVERASSEEMHAEGKSVTTAPTWSGTNVTVAEILDAVEDLRRNEQKAANRTSVATVIMVSRAPEDAEKIQEVLHHLRPRHPARVITLGIPDGVGELPDNINAGVVLLAGEAQNHAVWSDEIHLEATGGPARHRASMLRPLLLADLPVVVWWVSGLPDAGDPLLKLADTVVFDSKTALDPGEGEPAMRHVFDEVAKLSRKHAMADLSWIRLRIWRQMLASQFNGPVYRPFIQNIERIEITGKLGPRTLLAGWAASRLRLDRSVIHTFDGRHVSIKMVCSANGQKAEFLVQRIENEPLVQASAAVVNGPSHKEILGMPDEGTSGALLAVLRRLERDRVYEQAIRYVGGWL